jgi:hypothetical protein
LAPPVVPAPPWVGVVTVELVLTPDPLGEITPDPVVSVVVLEVVLVLFFDGFSAARICSAWTMKLRQMMAGYVPPSTGAPL